MDQGNILKSIRALSDDNYVKIMREAFSRDDRDLATLKRVADHNQKRWKIWKRESVKKSSNGGNESPSTEDLNEFVEVSPWRHKDKNFLKNIFDLSM